MFILALLFTSRLALAQSPVHSQSYDHGVVVSQSTIASEVGRDILERGGNAVDAAVATAFALAVTHPSAGNIGGGGFMVVRLPNGKATTFDFREKAPLAATDRMFLDENGEYDFKRHHWSVLSVGVPGSVAGLHLAHQRLGKLEWKELLQPAVRLADRGFPVGQALASSLAAVLPSMEKYPVSFSQFSRSGTPLGPGETLTQKRLAQTLALIRDQGRAVFYRGVTADRIVAEMQRLGGLITLDDLARYRAAQRPPVVGTYRGHQIIGMAPPSSGGIAVVEMLNLLEAFPLRTMGLRSAESTHLILESMRRAFADRALHVGDPDHVDVPLARLTDKRYATTLRRTISRQRASVSSPKSFTWPSESSETTHLSVVDASRMAVSLTTTLEQSYGSKIVVTSAGFLLNNEMGDFNPVPGVTNGQGRIGTRANLVAPEKRMISSMSPTIVARDGHVRLVVGTPGGRAIINSVLLVILGVIDFDLSVQQAVDTPRFHHQWLPDRVIAERWCFSSDTAKILEGMGHTVQFRSSPIFGSVMAIAVEGADDEHPGRVTAGVDRRRGGAGAAGY